jgi:hypothetical protein
LGTESGAGKSLLCRILHSQSDSLGFECDGL